MALLLGCSKSKTPASSDTATSEAASPAQTGIDACSLLTSDEIEAVQGEPFKERKSDKKSEGNLFVSHCYFALPTFSNSISLQVVQGGTKGKPGDLKQFWKEMFHKEQPTPAGEGARKKEPPKRIEQLGDEAFWAGNQKVGALYVLKGDRYIRVSVGGEGDAEVKLTKSMDIARLVLKRL